MTGVKYVQAMGFVASHKIWAKSLIMCKVASDVQLVQFCVNNVAHAGAAKEELILYPFDFIV